MVLTLYYFRDRYAQVQTAFTVLSVIAVLYIVNQEGSSAFKIAWILPIVFLPFFGIPLYFLFGKKRVPERKLERVQRHGPALPRRDGPAAARRRGGAACRRGRGLQIAYLEEFAASPGFTQTETKYYPCGDELFSRHARGARGRGALHLHGVLHNRARRDVGLHPRRAQAQGRRGRGRAAHLRRHGLHHAPAARLPAGDGALGIRCCTFHRFQPVPTGTLNNRDHRKICVHRRRHRLHRRRQPRRRVHKPARALRALARLRRCACADARPTPSR